MGASYFSRRAVFGSAAGAWIARSGGALAADKISVGATLPLTGSLAAAGQQQQFALQLAQDEINAAGGIAGRPLDIVYEDAQASNSSAVTAFISLTRRINPPFVFLSSYTTQNLAVGPSVARAGIPVVYGGGGASVADAGNKWLFRIRPEDTIQAQAMTEFAMADLQTKRPGILFLQNEFGQGVAASAKELLAAKNIPLVASESFKVGDSDFTAQVLAMRSKGADLIILVGYPREGALILKQCHQLGIEASLLTSSGVMLPAAIDLMEPNELTKVYGIVDVLLSTDRSADVARYVQTFDQRFKIHADAFGVCYYSSAFLLKKAIEAVGLTPEKLREYFASVQGFKGVGQEFSSDKRGNMVHSQDIVKFKSGTKQQEYVRTVKT